MMLVLLLYACCIGVFSSRRFAAACDADVAVRLLVGDGECEQIPFWHVEADKYQIERIIPFYPFSRDRAKLSSLLKTLAIYRLAFGQPRPAELVEHLLTNIPNECIGDSRDKLMIDLSPISYQSSNGTPYPVEPTGT